MMGPSVATETSPRRDQTTRCVMCQKRCSPLFALPCHVVCTPCLELLSSHRDLYDVILCPECHRIYAFTEDWQTRFCTFRNDQQTTSVIRRCQRCKPINGSKIHNHAEQYCYQCQQSLCRHCHVTVHVTSRPRRRHHIVVPLLPTDWVLWHQEGVTLCPAHPNQSLSFFCVTCSHPLCCSCAEVGHGDHELWDVGSSLKNARNTLSARLELMKDHHRVLLRLVNFLCFLHQTLHRPPSLQHLQFFGSSFGQDTDQDSNLDSHITTDVSTRKTSSHLPLKPRRKRNKKAGESPSSVREAEGVQLPDMPGATNTTNDSSFSGQEGPLQRQQKKMERTARRPPRSASSCEHKCTPFHTETTHQVISSLSHSSDSQSVSLCKAGKSSMHSVKTKCSSSAKSHALQNRTDAFETNSDIVKSVLSASETDPASTESASCVTLSRKICKSMSCAKFSGNTGAQTKASFSRSTLQSDFEDEAESVIAENKTDTAMSEGLPQLMDKAKTTSSECDKESELSQLVTSVFGASFPDHLKAARTVLNVLESRVGRLSYELYCVDRSALACVSVWLTARPVITQHLYDILNDKFPGESSADLDPSLDSGSLPHDVGLVSSQDSRAWSDECVTGDNCNAAVTTGPVSSGTRVVMGTYDCVTGEFSNKTAATFGPESVDVQNRPDRLHAANAEVSESDEEALTQEFLELQTLEKDMDRAISSLYARSRSETLTTL